MSRQQGLFPFSANFEPRIASPLDSRLVANTVSNLTDVAYWTSSDGGIYLYKGISVNVWNDTIDNNGIYVLIDDDYTDIDNWLKVGSSGSGVTFSSIETGPGLSVINSGTYSTISIEDTTAGEGLTFSNGVYDINWGGTASGLTFSNDALNVVVDGQTIVINDDGALSASSSTYYKVNNFSNLDSVVISSGVDSLGNIYIFSEQGTRYGETTGLNRLVKLNPDGTLNQGFTHGTGFNGGLQYLNSGLHVNSDDTLFVWGYFTQYNGQTSNRIVKLNSDGTIDTSFNIGTGFNSAVNHVYVDELNSSLYCVGTFTSYNGNPRNRIVKLNFDGTIDNTFDIGTGFNGIGGYISEIDGDIFVGGAFTTYRGNSSPRYVRINKADGSFDPSFVSQGNNGPGSTLDYIKEYNGKALIYGSFTTYGSQPLSRIGLLNLDGTIDTSFNVGKGIRRPIDNDTPSSAIFIRNVFIDSDNTLLVTCQNPLQLYDDTWVGELIRLNSTGDIVNNYIGINHKIQHLLKVGATYYAATYDTFDPEGYGDFSFSPLDFNRGATYEYRGYKLLSNGRFISSSNLDEANTEFETNLITERDVKGEIKKYLNLLEFPESISNVAVGPGLSVINSGTYSTIFIEDTTAGQGLTFSNGIFDINWGGTASGLTFSNDNLVVNVDGTTVIINNNGELSAIESNITPQYLTSSGDILSLGLTISGTVSLYSRLQVFINGLEESVGLSAGTGASLPSFSNQSIIFDSGVLTWNDSGAGYILDSNDEVRIIYGS